MLQQCASLFQDHVIIKIKLSQFSWFLDFYFSLHFVKMFEYIKSYLKMSN